MNVTLNGVVVKVLPLQKFDSGFQKREVIVNTNPGGKWPNEMAVTFVKEDVALLDNAKPGAEVSVEAFLNGRSWLRDGEAESKRKWFMELKGKSITYKASQTEGEELEVIEGDLPF